MTISPQPHAGPAAGDIWLRFAPFCFVLMWSTGYIAAKYGLPYADTFVFLTLRCSIVAVLFALISVFTSAPWPGLVPAFHSAVVGMLVHGAYLGSVFLAIDSGMPSGVSALIVGLQPLLTAILAGLLLGETITLRHWAGLALGLGGLALVLAPKLNLADSGITPLTISMMLTGVVSITLGTLYQKYFAVGSDLRTGAVYQYLGGFAFSAAAVLIFGQTHVEWTREFVLSLSWLVIVLSGGAVLLLMLMIRHGAVSRIATVFYLVAPTTALMGWAMFGETLTNIQLAGTVITVAGVALAGRRWRQAPA